MPVSPLTRYLDELYRWNERVNLTTVPRADAERRHVAETERLLAVLEPGPGARCADVGSGGGVPGMVIALLRPDMRLTLIESDRRKAGFLTHAAGVCGCANVTVVAERAEVTGHDPAHRGAYDLVVSRATAPSPVLVELALPLLRTGGRLAALVGDAAWESRVCRFVAECCGGSAPVALAPDIVAIDKVAETPEIYPRRTGVPRRKPLR